jgi:hypothetical protein
MKRQQTYYKFRLWIRGLKRVFRFPDAALTSRRRKEKRENNCCPYCIVDAKFLPMRMVSEGRMICGHCGHIVLRGDWKFRCPCTKCVEIDYSPSFRSIRRR